MRKEDLEAPSEQGSEIVWTVDPYCDRLRELSRKKAGDGMGMFNLRRYWVFDNRELALDFMVQRARNAAESARLALKSAERRLKKCQPLK